MAGSHGTFTVAPTVPHQSAVLSVFTISESRLDISATADPPFSVYHFFHLGTRLNYIGHIIVRPSTVHKRCRRVMS